MARVVATPAGQQRERPAWLLQDCLARALGKLHLWQEDTNLQGWLMRILHNQHVNHVRRQIHMGITVGLDAVPYLTCPADQDKGLELRDLECALGQLPEVQRAAINLVGRNGMDYAVASMVLGTPVGTVRSRLSRGRTALRHLLAPESDGSIGHAAVMARPLSMHCRSRPRTEPGSEAAAKAP